MKKIFLALALLFTIGTTMRVSAQQVQRQTFYYYPSSNIYYDVATGEYWYYDEPTVKWVIVKTLPSTITLERAPIDTVYYNGPDVWKDNAEHQRKYKHKKDEDKKKQ